MKDFINKAMFYQINNSPEYRDRIQSGVETMNMVSQATAQIDEMRGGNKEETFEEKANKIQNANKVIDGVQKLSGKEEEMANEILSLGYKAVEEIGGSVARGRADTSDIDSDVNVNEGEM